ncbi:PLP-dependent decarboxylase [Thalassotalea sp. LPB0316]|uniref:PLP-dependent decarboxylase n=1 Tax=Thalassotalea sp. LPB0316 TaxID=2769490 RepID=UPI001867034B|nr:PLP-dependent decarboxylase [Thalassotalea sp. LPB0316]QOL26038.1 PLP-dependent decarboxylase [Thalassotalea sp. LPB0316]
MNQVSQLPHIIAPEFIRAIEDHHNHFSSEHGYFIYHLDKLRLHLANLQQQDVVKLWFAVKANPLSRVIQTIAQQGFCFDVASDGELEQVLAQGVSAKNILNTGPAKSKRQLQRFIDKGVNTFVVESINQLAWLNELAQDNKITPTVLLRVQLQWPEGEKNPLGGNELTPFGLNLEQWQTIKLSDFPALNICGIHIFQWGNMLSNAKMFSLWSQMIEPLVGLAEDLGFELEILDLGGGLGIDYLQTGQAIDWSMAMRDLAEIKAKAQVKEIWLELGRYAVAQAGYYVAPIVDKKLNAGEQQLILAGGINHLLRPAITSQPFPARMLRTSNQVSENYHVHGPLCTSMDKLGIFALPNDVAVGDALLFGLCGAYGFTESMPFFLCHDIAAEYVFENLTFELVREPQSPTWYLR